MRTAAIGLFFLPCPDELAVNVADISRITHQDPRSIAGGVAVASAARLLTAQPDVPAEVLCGVVADDMRSFHTEFAELVAGLPAQFNKGKAATLEYVAWSGGKEREFEEVIITPYVVPTVLASLWAAITFATSWPDAVAGVIGLGGDVDTLGAIVGGLMGARLGLHAIPEHLVESVLDSQRLRDLAIRYTQVIQRHSAAG
jgi:ADP-ribosylglycohydrolase